MASNRTLVAATLAFVSFACQSAPPHLESRDWDDQASASHEASSATYVTRPERCGGFPSVSLETPPGFCVGLVESNVPSKTAPLMVAPRSAAAVGNDLVIADMGEWNSTSGRIFALKRLPDGPENEDGQIRMQRVLLLEANDLPSKLREAMRMPAFVRLGPDKKIWASSATMVFRFDPSLAKFARANLNEQALKRIRSEIAKSIEVILQGLPAHRWGQPSEASLHPLKPFVIAPNRKTLYVGVGASTDACGPVTDPKLPCAEAEGRDEVYTDANASLWRYELDPKTLRLKSSEPEVHALGLRNSLGLAYASQPGRLTQVESGIDSTDGEALDAFYPADELNLIEAEAHYGWPYCTEFRQPTQAWKTGDWDCNKFMPPLLLLPPHSAPFALEYYGIGNFPEWYKHKAIVALHSRERFGHRLVTFEVDSLGYPRGRPLTLIGGWGAKDRPDQVLGSPSGIAPARDGSVYIVEDRNRTVLRLFYDPDKDTSEGRQRPLPLADDDAWIYRHR